VTQSNAEQKHATLQQFANNVKSVAGNTITALSST
jgi:hypothetical protein